MTLRSDAIGMALLVGELYARVTSDSSQYRGDMDKVDAQGARSAKLAESNALKIEAARRAEMAAAAKARLAEALLEKAREDNVSADKLAAAEARLASARLALSNAQQKTVAVEHQVAASYEDTAKAADKAGDATEQTAKKIELADRHALKFTATLIGLGAAGGVAGVGVAAGLAAVPILLGVLAAVALSTRDDVADAWSDVGSEMASGIKEDMAPLADELVLASGQVAAGFRKIRPELRAMAEDGGPALTVLIDGVVKLATNALPGARRALTDTAEGVAGFNALLDHTGDGLSAFFDGIADGSISAGRNAGEFGLVIEDLLGFTGSLLTMLSDDFDGTFSDVRRLLDETTDSTLGLADGALPALAASGGTVVSMVSSLLAMLGPLAPLLGTIVGVMLSAKAGAAIFGAAGDAVGKFGGKIESTAVGAGKAAGAVRGLGAGLGAIGPWGAIAGASLLGVVAASDALWGSTDALASKLMAGGNAADQASRKLAENTVQAEMLKLNTNGLVAAVAHLIPTMGDADEAVSKQKASMTTLQRAQQGASEAQANHSKAVQDFGPSSSAAAAASAALSHKQQDLKNAQYDAAQATKTLTDRLLEQQSIALGLANSNLNLRMATNAWEQAQGSLNEMVKAGKSSALELQAAQQGVESAALRVIDASAKEALGHHVNQESVEAQTAAMEAGNAKALELAGSMSGPVPAALQTLIANMDDSTLSAQGATRSIDETNTTVINLKDGKVIKIEAKDQATHKINGIQSSIDNMRGRTLEIHIKQLVSTEGPPMADLGNPAAVLPKPRAAGGPVKAGQMYQVNEQGKEYYVPAQDGLILRADQRRALDEMLRTGGSPARGNGNMSGGTVVNKSYNITLNAIRSLPTAMELQNVLHDSEVMYG